MISGAGAEVNYENLGTCVPLLLLRKAMEQLH